MFKKYLTLATCLLFFFTLTLEPLSGRTSFLENTESQDTEVKLESKEEEIINATRKLHLSQSTLLYQVCVFPEIVLNDYVVYLGEDFKPPRHFPIFL